MSSTLGLAEKAQLEQTIEMFEVITQSQPQDYQSLEILKEAYSNLNREAEVIKTSKRIAEAYVQLGQLSSAILEYETILQRSPNDADVVAALKAIESRANTTFIPAPSAAALGTAEAAAKPAAPGRANRAKADKPAAATAIDDGRQAMHKIFVDGKIISAGDFDLCWHTPDPNMPPNGVIEPFIQILADKGVVPPETSLKALIEKSRLAYLPLDRYDMDADLARTFPAEVCQRWCVLPFDRMSKTVMVATANPFNKQAASEIAEATQNRIVWYIAAPVDIVKNLRKAFR